MSKKITAFDKATCRDLAERVEAALRPLADELGVVFAAKGGSFTGGQFTMKLEAATVSADGAVNSRESEMFARYAETYGLKPDALGKTFRGGAKVFTVCGLNPRAHANPVIATDSESRRYKFPVASLPSELRVDARGPQHSGARP